MVTASRIGRWIVLTLAACAGGCGSPTTAAFAADDHADLGEVVVCALQPLVTPRYVSPISTWSLVSSVCLDDGAPPLAASRFSALAARAQLPVVATGPGCDWRLSFAAAPPALDSDGAAAWSAAGATPERFVVATATADAALQTTAYAVDPRGARYAVDAAFSQLCFPAPGSAPSLAVAAIVDWPALPVRGVVEGFYGPPFPDADRVSLLGWLDEARENTYVYGPQNDDYAHADWYAPYPDDQLSALAHAATAAADAGIDFVWAVRPGQGLYYPSDQPITYSSDDDLATLLAKLEQLRGVGVSRFGLFFDDNIATLSATEDQEDFGSLVAAQTYLINRVSDYLTASDADARLLVVGTDYAATSTGWQDYNQFWADNLRPNVDVMWTGNESYSPTIAAADLTPVTSSLGRQPLIWDNWPRTITALTGRSPDLPTATPGLLSNPVICSWQHATAGMFAEVLGTEGMYAWQPASYDATTALSRWQAAQAFIAPP